MEKQVQTDYAGKPVESCPTSFSSRSRFSLLLAFWSCFPTIGDHFLTLEIPAWELTNEG
jgi:hypothetical protein